MKVIAYDLFPNKNLDFLEYVSLDELLATSDLISLHCPMTPGNRASDQLRNHCKNERWCDPCKYLQRWTDQNR